MTVVEKLQGRKLIAVVAAAKKSAKATKKTVVVGTTTVTIAGGHGQMVKLSLNSTGKKLLAKHSPLKARLTITQSRKAITSSTITFRTKKTKK